MSRCPTISVRHLTGASDENRREELEFVREMVGWGAGPRAVQFLILAGRPVLSFTVELTSAEDIQALAAAVLRHRLVVNFAAESDGITADHVVDRLIEVTPTAEDELTRDARFQKILHPGDDQTDRENGSPCPSHC